MKIVMILSACASFALGPFAFVALTDEGQLQLGATGIIGGFVLTGIATIIDRIDGV